MIDNVAEDGERNAHRQLRIVFAGELAIGVLVDQIDTISSWQTPTPLPNAPSCVLGVVALRGRMLTVIDLQAVVKSTPSKQPKSIVALSGDEQLALAVDQVGDLITTSSFGRTADLDSVMLANIERDGLQIGVLNTEALFATAIRGYERRRRRF